MTDLRRGLTVLLAATALAACTGDPPAQGSEAAAVLINPHIPRGATWSYWDRGGDLGTAWTSPSFDDAAWASGAGPLGYGESYLATTVGYGPSPSNKHVTTYFRHEFQVANHEGIYRMLGEVMFDDGIVVYLNGTRIDDDSMPAGGSTASTYALGHEAGNAYVTYDWLEQSDLLINGLNVIAVEVHQADAGSSDLVFDLALELTGARPVLPTQIARRSTWMYNDVYGPMDASWTSHGFNTYQFQPGAAPLGYGESYLATQLRQPTLSWQAPTTYFRKEFLVEDPGAVTELSGELMYDDGMVVWLNGTRIDTRSMPSGPIAQGTLALGHEAGNAYEPRDWNAFRSYLVQGTNLIAVELHQSARTSSDAVFDLSLAVVISPPPPVPTEDIARGATWTYWDRGGDQGTAWRAPSFDDTTWRRNLAPLGYGESYLATVVSYGPDAGNKYRTTYFRNRFRVADRTAVTGLMADVMYDDGVVIYLNGQEVKRLFMPSGTVTASTLALGHETGTTYERHDLGAARNLLVDGDNVITVEVHQSSASSSDLTFDLALDVSTAGPPPPPAAAGIARGSSWRVLTQPAEPDSEWPDDDFDDTSWPYLPGPLGYGESYLRSTISYGPDPQYKYGTTYFRKSFVIEDPELVSGLVAELMYDDGAAIYLNGQEVARRSLPAGSLAANTRATWHEAHNAYEPIDLAAAIGHLRAGRNTLAVRVHQDDAASSDLVFDLALRVDTVAPPATFPRKSTWLYYDRGPLPAGWQTSSDNTGWDGGRGPLGQQAGAATYIGYDYPEPDRRPTTTYFRRAFTVEDHAAVTELRGYLMYSHGAVIYLNGLEVARPSMPPGDITFDTLALPHPGDGGHESFDWTAAAGHLRTGENVIAVEIHHSAAGDSILFDLGLELIDPTTARIPGCMPMTPPQGVFLNSVWIAPGGAVWTAGSDGMIGRRSSDGQWVWCARSPNGGYAAVWGAADDDVWLVGSSGTVLRWDGSDFDAIELGTTANLSGVWGSDPSNVFISGSQGTLRHFDGDVWRNADIDGGHHLNDVWGASPGDVWAVGVYHYSDETESGYELDSCVSEVYRWNPTTFSFALEEGNLQQHGGCGFDGIGGSSATDVWAVGDDFPAGAAAGFAMAMHYDGIQWTTTNPRNGPDDEDLMIDRTYSDVVVGVPGSPDSVWITAWGPSAVHREGTTWLEAEEPLTRDLASIDVRGDAMFSVGYDAKVLRWDGTTWVREH